MLRFTLMLSTALLPLFASAQTNGPMDHAKPADQAAGMGTMKHEAAVPSTTLTITGLYGTKHTLTLDQVRLMPHINITVTNGHTHRQEIYSGVPVKSFLDFADTGPVPSPVGTVPVSPRMIAVIAEGTDRYKIAMTVCDTDPSCRSGQALVADSLDNHPLTTDGAFKLILTEDKTPGRWVRNLSSLSEKDLGAM